MKNNYLSLFDFLGYPAGLDLGLWVWKQAKKEKIDIQRRQVKTIKYDGPVDLYPEHFLKKYLKR